jgi:glycosyltransferase involved in cell wall biosynthesis
MLRVKNESRWIEEVITSLKRLCDPIIVMDDGSEDSTAAICAANGAIVYQSPYSDLNEARDKDWLLLKVEQHCAAGTWVLCIDGDEVLEEAGPAKIKAVIANRGAEAYTFKILYLWDSRHSVRVDGVYSRFYRPSMFRLQHGMSFQRTDASGNLHCSSVPAACIGRCEQTDIRLLHLGYMLRSDRLRKYDWYTRIDGQNQAEDGYRHMVIGDIFPATSAFVHAGPLKLEALHG